VAGGLGFVTALEALEERSMTTCLDPWTAEGEADLVARVRAGDEAACTDLVRRHAPALLARARRLLGCDAEGADAVQDALLAAFRAIGSFAGQARLGTWLHRIVINECLMRRRRKRPRTVPLDDLLPAFGASGRHARAVAPWAADAPERLTRAETRAQVRACIDRLPDAYRAVILLRDIEGLDTDQAAEVLGTNRGVVKTRLHRARQALRALLEPLVLRGQLV
jgi:RNA polymerase sigma-70 factor (ECF subfamily)